VLPPVESVTAAMNRRSGADRVRRPVDARPNAQAGGAALLVGIVEAEEVFRRGLVASLEEDDAIEVVFAVPNDPPPRSVDVLVLSPEAHAPAECQSAVVVCGAFPARAERAAPHVAAYLSRGRLTAAQLVATVHAAAVGLRIDAPPMHEREERFDQRRRKILRLLAEGADTRTISRSLCYSERTVKGLIHDIVHELHAENRAHAVAVGIREGLI